ncbi:radical SAM protein [Clostridium estertheticum]|uniref:elongator complex protein 3 n=1 Tax=Clostridium estertheticum TaxID=238834 RepID=UPI001C6EC619|nr:radical SAM protein [Clostridium estertheticum]MBW9170848.1 radical SAM protein [Clostridium estertheticum]WLC74313.1 radical SAM protein [Clostridium estertheticum]
MSNLHYIIPIFVPHEGCPHECVFCNQDSITGTKSKVDAMYVQKTINEYLETIKNDDAIIEVSFFGGTFTAIKIEKQIELLTVAKKFKDNNKIKYIRLSTRPDYIDDNILKNLKKYSVDIIELGVQSMDEEVLLKSGRGHTASDVEYASKLIRQYGFTLGHQIMIGLPGDNITKDIETTKRVIDLKPDICRIYPALVIKNTQMEKMYIEHKFKPYSLSEAVNISKIIYIMLTQNQINVIRIGLQPTSEISEGHDLVAGPFHPAFRELVEGSIYSDLIYDVIVNSFNKEVIHDKALVKINPKDISKLYANGKIYFNELKNRLKTISIDVSQDITVKRGSLSIKIKERCIIMTIYEYVSIKYKKNSDLV